MKKLMLVGVLGLAMVAAIGCSGEKPAGEAAQQAETAPVNIFEVRTKWLSDFAIGSELGPDGKVAAQKNAFAPGDPIVYSTTVGEAPPASAAKIVWMGPNETKLAEETKGIPAGQKVLNFTAPDTAAWPVGSYEAQLWVVDEKVNGQKFAIAGPDAATTTDTAAKKK